MSTPSLRKSNSPSSWGVKQCLKVAAGLVALSQVSIAQACRPSTISITYEQDYTEVCIGKACSSRFTLVGNMGLEIRNHYKKSFYYTAGEFRSTWEEVGKKCSGDDAFCITFYGPDDAKLHYGGKIIDLGAPNVLKGSQSWGSAEWWNCL
ncbi:hypothetical protein BGX24_000046 [Mortierella sp. AD032]|nr:hypothetical protein BGX24_000046 [Mortierella sp. AD032]